MKEIEPKRSAASWLADLAKGRYGEYALSVLTALLGVACSLIPYFIIIRLITALVNGTAELPRCLTLCAWMAGCWVLRYVLHSVSTSLSHHATFHVLANTRVRLLDKLATLPLAECTKHIAYVSQDNYLFDLSVMDNIRMGRKGATDAEVIDAAKKCGCHEFIMGLENGYQTVCGASGGHLSGGERQRISIARAMLKDAPIVILDEATSYTDPENEAVIQSALGRLVRGKTLLVIAHRLSTIADADQIIVVNQGKIEATGTQAELLASCPLYQTMWEAHISVKDDGEVA